MNFKSKILILGLIMMLIALAPIMVSAAQLPMELPTVSSNYSPDSIENYEYRGKKLFPSPV